MGRYFVLTFIAIVIAPQGALLAAPRIAANEKPLRLARMDYSPARALILKNGWRPLGGPCSQVDKNTCEHFPEIGSCTMVSPSYCGMVFVKNDQCLYVVTTGDGPEGNDAGAMKIKSANYRPGPCSKD